MTADQILRSLINDVGDPDKSNGPVAVHHADLAKEYFLNEGKKNAIQKPSPKAQVPRARQPGKNEAVSAPAVGEGDTQRRETTRAHKALLPTQTAG